jgi:hypothetical protein
MEINVINYYCIVIILIYEKNIYNLYFLTYSIVGLKLSILFYYSLYLLSNECRFISITNLLFTNQNIYNLTIIHFKNLIVSNYVVLENTSVFKK